MSSYFPVWKQILHKTIPFLFFICKMDNKHWIWEKYCYCELGVNGVFYPIPLHPKSKKISNRNLVCFTCSNNALDVIEALKYMKFLGNIGSTASIYIEGCKDHWIFDGDGSAQIGNIYVNGMELK